MFICSVYVITSVIFRFSVIFNYLVIFICSVVFCFFQLFGYFICSVILSWFAIFSCSVISNRLRRSTRRQPASGKRSASSPSPSDGAWEKLQVCRVNFSFYGPHFTIIFWRNWYLNCWFILFCKEMFHTWFICANELFINIYIV